MKPKNRNSLAIGLILVGSAYAVASVTVFAPSATPYSRGAALVSENGCLSCHPGLMDGPTANPSRDPAVSNTTVPPLIGCDLEQGEFDEWVLQGVRSSLIASESFEHNRSARTLQMPAYDAYMDQADSADIRAWAQISHRALSRPPKPTPGSWAEAEILTAKYGCFDCHGELGQGGVQNPGSFTGEIPALVGDDFVHLTDDADPSAIRDWIALGESQAFLEGNPFAWLGRYFMAKQATQMPAYEGVIDERELNLIVDYTLHLNDLGPMTAEVFGAYVEELRVKEDGQEVAMSTSGGAEIPPGEAIPMAIAQLFSKHCIHCHGPEKQKSDYRMDTRGEAFDGGEIAAYLGVKNISPGNPADSFLSTLIHAVAEDPENEIFPMPPDDEEQLSAVEISLIEAWIESGAPWHENQTLFTTHSD